LTNTTAPNSAYGFDLPSWPFFSRLAAIMNASIKFKTATPLPFIPLLLVCFGLAPMAHAVGPDTEGAIAGANNGEGIGVLVNRTVGIWNTGTGFEALNHLIGGNQNTATGLRALSSDTNGGFNTATGVFSLFSNTSGFFNSATGAYSLANNTIGNYNTANGYSALYFNTEGEQNTATGFAALYRNRASNNTANGYQTLYSNTTGTDNTAIGDSALYDNFTGNSNTAIGSSALFFNFTGDANTAIGVAALASNDTGPANTAIGVDALLQNTSGGGNTAIGAGALFNLTAGSGNIAVGIEAGFNVTAAGNVIAIGSFGANVSNSCFIGNIRDVPTTIADAIPVVIDSAGQLGTTSSSRRYKEEIKAMEQASEAILALKPVTFHYKSDASGTPQFGLIAEEVAEVNADLVVRDENGEIYTVRYDAVNAMLLNEFLKEHRKVEELKNDFQATVAQQQKEIESLTAQLKEQAAQIQKVSAQFEMSRPAARTVLSNR
jgi:hypothetical protein